MVNQDMTAEADTICLFSMFKMIHQLRQRGRRWSRISLTVSRPLLPSGGCLEAATRMTEWPRRDHSDVSRKHDTAVSGDTSHSQTRHARPDTWGAVSRVHLMILTTDDSSINHQCLKLSCYWLWTTGYTFFHRQLFSSTWHSKINHFTQKVSHQYNFRVEK